jgi:hypothetical protein
MDKSGGIDSHIFRVAAMVEGEGDEPNRDEHKNDGYSADTIRAPFLLDRCYHLLIGVLALLGETEPLPKLVRDLFAAQLRTYPR